jgi:hypothetical protein
MKPKAFWTAIIVSVLYLGLVAFLYKHGNIKPAPQVKGRIDLRVKANADKFHQDIQRFKAGER